MISKDTEKYRKDICQAISGSGRKRDWREEREFSLLFMSTLTESVATSTYFVKKKKRFAKGALL